jgi:hypothetical protein
LVSAEAGLTCLQALWPTLASLSELPGDKEEMGDGDRSADSWGWGWGWGWGMLVSSAL